MFLKVLCEEDDETPVAALKDGKIIGEVRSLWLRVRLGGSVRVRVGVEETSVGVMKDDTMRPRRERQFV